MIGSNAILLNIVLWYVAIRFIIWPTLLVVCPIVWYIVSIPSRIYHAIVDPINKWADDHYQKRTPIGNFFRGAQIVFYTCFFGIIILGSVIGFMKTI